MSPATVRNAKKYKKTKYSMYVSHKENYFGILGVVPVGKYPLNGYHSSKTSFGLFSCVIITNEGISLTCPLICGNNMNKRAKELTKQIPNYGKIPVLRYKGLKGKAWKVLSDYVRMRDFIVYGFCISSGKKIENWNDTDAGHYETMGGHGALVGFSDINIHAQSKDDNAWGGMASGARYRDELVRRYGENILVEIENLKRQSVKADDFFFIEKIFEIRGKFLELKNKYPQYNYPDYL